MVFFGETLDSHILTKVEKEMEVCDLCLVVGAQMHIMLFSFFQSSIFHKFSWAPC